MDALDYEYLIRRAHQCGRHGVNGANADIFRRYERAERLYRSEKENDEMGKPRQWGESIETLSFKSAEKSREVTFHLSSAIEKVLMDFEMIIGKEQREILENCIRKLYKPNYTTIKEVIKEAQTVMIELGLKMK